MTMITSMRSRSAIRFSPALEKSLSAYAVAATAAGVGLLALTSPAAARIVYTPANTPIPVNGGPVPLDINHDGVVDFSFSNQLRTASHVELFLLQAFPKAKSNAIWGRGSFGSSFFNFGGAFAAALRPGLAVGTNRSYFQKGKNGILGVYKGAFSSGSFTTQTYRQWLNTKSRYLGVQFLIDGQLHYGWARLKVAKPGQAAFRPCSPATPTRPSPTSPSSQERSKARTLSLWNQRPSGDWRKDQLGFQLGGKAAAIGILPRTNHFSAEFLLDPAAPGSARWPAHLYVL